MPQNFDQLMSNANRANAEGRLDDAEKLCDAILQQFPANVPALVLQGIVRSRNGKNADAILSFEKAVKADPRCAPAYQWLSMSLRTQGEYEKALSAALSAIRLNPSDPIAHHHLGLCYMDIRQFAPAEASFRKAAGMAPNVALVHLSLGLSLKAQKRNQEAIASIRRSIALKPSSIEAHIALRDVLIETLDFAAAAEAARSVVDVDPESAEHRLWLARVLIEGNRPEEADIHIEFARQKNPDTVAAHSLLGRIYQTKGQIQAANRHYLRSLELFPSQGSAYLAVATNQKIREEDRPLVEKMKAALEDVGLPTEERCQLEYALGKAREDLGEYAAAMAHFDAANRLDYELKFGTRSFDRQAFKARTDRTVRTFDPVFFERNLEAGSQSALPIFVVGMIRSGTTLIEQILSCHPEVGAAGEQSFWLENSDRLLLGDQLNPSLSRKLTDQYLGILREIAPGKSRVVDKMPMNYEVLGLIHTLLPNAKIIHIRRDPVDTCLSIYTTHNRARLGWAGDKANIVFNYRLYEALMEHWRQVLTSESLLEVRYEDLVENPEPVTRTVISFLDLDWHDACLRPEDNRRSILTPSVGQVRQPIYRTSVARWKKYEDVLGPFERLSGH